MVFIASNTHFSSKKFPQKSPFVLKLDDEMLLNLQKYHAH